MTDDTWGIDDVIHRYADIDRLKRLIMNIGLESKINGTPPDEVRMQDIHQNIKLMKLQNGLDVLELKWARWSGSGAEQMDTAPLRDLHSKTHGLRRKLKLFLGEV